VTDEAVREFALRCPVPLPPGERVLLAHGSGGKLSAQLIRDLFVPILGDPTSELARLGDAAVVEVDGVRLAFSTDSFVVTPKFFPGSNIGELAVNGTVNDLAMMGARSGAAPTGCSSPRQASAWFPRASRWVPSARGQAIA
jgi:hydrogenase expression/formation protein HypE